MFSAWASVLDSHADGHNKHFRRDTFLFFAIVNMFLLPVLVLVLLLLLLLLSSSFLLSVLGGRTYYFSTDFFPTVNLLDNLTTFDSVIQTTRDVILTRLFFLMDRLFTAIKKPNLIVPLWSTHERPLDLMTAFSWQQEPIVDPSGARERSHGLLMAGCLQTPTVIH
jgi:hypothetical protein